MPWVQPWHLVAAAVALVLVWAILFTYNAIREWRQRNRIWASIGGRHWKPKGRIWSDPR